MPDVTRREFLIRGGLAGAAIASGTLWATGCGQKDEPVTSPREGPIRHIVISCQENRSFDHYFGYAPQVQAKGFGPPPGYTQPDGAGGTVAPYQLTALRAPTPPTPGPAVHAAVRRRPDGRLLRQLGRRSRLGYYTARELPFYYSLFGRPALCANYFCSVLGPTWPNRFYLMSGTSGGITNNGQWGYGIFDSAGWPIILDLLDDGRRHVEDLQPRRHRRRPERRERQRRGLLEPLGPRPPHHGAAGGLPRTTAARAGCRRSRG